MSLTKLINSYDMAYRAMGSQMPGSAHWDADVRALNDIGASLLAYPCQTAKQYRRWLKYIRSVVGLSAAVSREQAFDGLMAARAADIAKRPGKTFDDPKPTYEVGIDGTDRIAVVEPRQGWGRYHKRYPFDVMEIGETVTLPGKRRTDVSAVIQAAQFQHNRKFRTSATEAGLRIERIS